MRQVFEGAGLSAPPVPPDLEPRVRRRGDWLYATRRIDPMAMYMFLDHVTEAMSRRVGDYMAVCHAGHGVNSYCVNYHLVWGPVAIYFFSTGAIAKGLGLTLFGSLVIGTVDNVLRPVLVGKDTRLPDWVVLVSTLGGMSLFGINGFVIGPLIAALFISCWDLLRRDQRGGTD